MDFDRIQLEPEQKELLARLVEAVRSVSSDQRQSVFFIQHSGGSDVVHPGWQKGATIHAGDLRMLARANLVLLRSDDEYMTQIDVTPEGFTYYRELKQRSGQPIERQSTTVKSYLDSAAFRSRHGAAYARWAEAEELLWASDSDAQLTTIGHKCREAMHAFAEDLIVRYQPPNPDTDVTHVKNRIKAVLAHRKPQLSDTVSEFLDTLADLWDAVNELVQRQEHGRALTWEDGRRVVLQTAIAMFEMDRTLT
jgi:hypothetical protein